MTEKIRKILREYWGHDSFRPMQEEIILSALEQKDTLALMPTGGGKSVCFQIPVLAVEGSMGIVISPLIALMNDQVHNLNENGIPAVCIHSGLSYKEIDQSLEKCMRGHYRFLYLSPERLKTDIVKERIKRMNVQLIAIDEAHCISQWGHDFRPAYREIAQIRQLLPHVPVLALTATATPSVAKDICRQLEFKEELILRKSFYRENLTYLVDLSEQKWAKTLSILKSERGTAIIYMRSRRHCVEVASWLNDNGLQATYYHAGLSYREREERQAKWLVGDIRIMVCTNAFGMGVDKPDVRTVIHLDLPDSIEAYFQEAGRAGRDGRSARSYILAGRSDLDSLVKKSLDGFPDLEFIRKVYRHLVNKFQLAEGAGEGEQFEIDLQSFARSQELPLNMTYQAIQIMEREAILQFSEGFAQSARLKILIDRYSLYDLQLRNPQIDRFIRELTRSYGGLDLEYVMISEYLLAQRLNTSVEKVVEMLKRLHEQKILDYQESNDKAWIRFLKAREKVDHLRISDKNLKERYEDKKARVNSMIEYVEETQICRSQFLLAYFGETESQACGSCDVCKSRETKAFNRENTELLRKNILSMLQESPLSFEEICQRTGEDQKVLMQLIELMIDREELTQDLNMIRLKS